MARVTILTHSEFVHAKTGVHFRPHNMPNAEGHIVVLGVADVADAVAHAHFVGHPSFRVEGLEPTDEEERGEGEQGAASDSGEERRDFGTSDHPQTREELEAAPRAEDEGSAPPAAKGRGRSKQRAE